MKLIIALLTLSSVFMFSCDDSYINDPQNQPTSQTKSVKDVGTTLEAGNSMVASSSGQHIDPSGDPGCTFIGRYTADFRIPSGVDPTQTRGYTLRVDFATPGDRQITVVDAMPVYIRSYQSYGSYYLIELELEYEAIRILKQNNNETKIRLQTNKPIDYTIGRFYYYHIDLDVLY